MKTSHQLSPAVPGMIVATGNRWHDRIVAALTLVALLGAVPGTVAATYTWNVSSGNWSAPDSWTPASGTGGPLATDAVLFGNTGAGADSNAVNNVVDAGFGGSVAQLTYNSVSAAPYIYTVTQIPSGKTLTVMDRVLVGGLNEPASGGPFLTYARMIGGGTFAFTGTNLAVENYGTAAGANTYANFDLSGLTNFIFNNANGTLSIADTTLPQISGSQNVRAGGNFVLAGGSNFITVSNINLGTCTAPQGGPVSRLYFGAGTNVINVANFNIARQKNPAIALFAAPTGGLRIRGVNGTDISRANLIIGNRDVGSGTGTTSGQLLLNGHPVDILANLLTVGEVSTPSGPSSSGSGGQFGNGTLQFDTGVVDATSVVMALNTAPNANGGLSGATSLLAVGPNATLRVGSGGLVLLDQTASNVCSSTLIISNGAVVCNGNITVVTNAAAGSGAAAETNLIQFIGSGTLTLGAGNFAGTTNSPIGQIILDATSKLQFVAPPPNNQPAIAVDSLVWPADDHALTLVVSNLPATATVGSTFPLIHFNSMTGGAFVAPAVVLPPGVTGSLSLSNNTLLVTVTSSVYPALSPITPDNRLITLCTNRLLTTTAFSTVTTITNVQVIVQSTTLGSSVVNTVTNSPGSSGLTVTGLGTASANISFSLTTNRFYHSITFQATDANGVTVSLSTGNFDTIAPSLVIEAADFNYAGGQFIDTPPDGGLWLYQNLVGVEGVDEHKTPRSSSRIYRPDDAVVIQAANPGWGMPPSPTAQKFVTAAASGNTNEVETEVGYNSVGDWFNYTRTFGPGGSAPAGLYNVWCYLATSGTNVQASFSQVTSDPTQGNQTTNLLGYFGTPTFSDNGWNNFVYVPLVDKYGNRVSVSVGNGPQTFRTTVLGNPNLAYYVFVPATPVLTPVFLSVYPDGATPFESSGQFSFVVGPANGAPILTNDIHLTLNGVDVSSALSFSLDNGNWVVGCPIQSNALYTAVMTVTNADGLYATYTVSFDNFDPNNYQWEAVDYDFSTNNGSVWVSGLFIDDPVPTCDTNAIQAGTLATNSYFAYPTGWAPWVDPLGYGAVAQQGVDIYITNLQTGANSIYRADGVGAQAAADYLRPKFIAAQQTYGDPNIGPVNIGFFDAGQWLNYTRHFPTNTYNIWGRLACGNSSFSGLTLSRVTSGVGTSNQTTQVLGTFADAHPAGWQTYHWVPLLDTNGNKAVVSLGGQETLRLTSGGAVNPLFFMLVPATSPPQFNISAALVGGQVQISIPTQAGYTYTLWYADHLPATNWTQVGGSISGDGSLHSIQLPANGGAGFYRVRAQ
ncbi:MAG TPA: hypothetical protein VFB55_06080 [Verrucomicrobiae bacterium]|nr:hypothetical protein [Verrucomicrobiae bacterium]